MGRKAPRRRLRIIARRTDIGEHVEVLASAGYRLEVGPADQHTLRALAADPPAAVVIDLSRQPSLGRDIGVALRHTKRTRHIPLVFGGGAPDKVARVKEVLPDATFAGWSNVRSALRTAMRRIGEDLHVPASNLAGYSGTPLPRKLGIKQQSIVVLVNAPDDFERTLGTLPDGATLRSVNSGARDLTMWFVTAGRELEQRIDAMAAQVRDGGLWIAWPKQASGVPSDVTQNDVRRIGLAHGLVDYKICAIDATWSGLKFATRK
jgi:hypothetical protein